MKPEESVWKEDRLRKVDDISDVDKIRQENFLVNLMHFDKFSLFLPIITSPEPSLEDRDIHFTFSELVQELKKYYFFEDKEMYDRIVLESLDTLLDSAIFNATWVETNSYYQRKFSNRNEVFRPFGIYTQKILNISPLDSQYPELVVDLRRKIFLREEKLFPLAPYEDFDRINTVKNELTDFINNKLKNFAEKKSCDLLIPVMRKGIILSRKLIKNEFIEPYYNMCWNPYDFTNKKILVFDDAVNSGNTLVKTIENLIDLGVERDNIFLSGFLANEDNRDKIVDKISKMLERDINYDENFDKKLSGDNFILKVLDIIMYIASLGSITDPDHLIINVSFKKKPLYLDIFKALHEINFGEVFEPDLEHLHPNKKKLTILLRKKEYKDIGWFNDEYIKDIDLIKVRLVLELDSSFKKVNRIQIVPIVNPIIKIQKGKKSQLDLNNFEIIRKGKVWTKIKNIPPYNIPPYVDCIVYLMVSSLAKHFLNIFKREFEMKIKSIEWKYLTEKYGDDSVVYESNFGEIFKGLKKDLGKRN